MVQLRYISMQTLRCAWGLQPQGSGKLWARTCPLLTSLALHLSSLPFLATCRQRYKKAPSFFQLHLGVRDCAFQDKDGKLKDVECHHIILEDWAK